MVLVDVERGHELVREGHLHDLWRVPLCRDEVDYPPLGQDVDLLPPGRTTSSVLGRTSLTDLPCSNIDFTSISTSKCPALETMAPSLISSTAE